MGHKVMVEDSSKYKVRFVVPSMVFVALVTAGL